MKLLAFPSPPRRRAGVLLIECVTYIAVFAILLGLGTAAFFLCWNHSEAFIYATDDITGALHAGERWRADVRHATGPITVAESDGGQTVRMPQAQAVVAYRFADGKVCREIPALQQSQVVLRTVNASHMTGETRGGVRAWRWELDLKVRRTETHLPLLFTFEAAQTKP
jgi:Tfp pilus assembly protein FimT